MMLPTIILYTHTDYKDIWPIFFGQTSLYLNNFSKIIFVNKDDSNIPNDYEKIFYDDKLKYYERLTKSLSYLKNQPVLFIHEDMILYDIPKYDIIENFTDLIYTNKADFIQLIRTYNHPIIKTHLHSNLIKCPNNIFSVQPNICMKNNLEILFQQTLSENIWDFEMKVNDVGKNLNFRGFMSYDELENKRGHAHWDSMIFPYIATAIYKGKWNFLEYANELTFLLNKYNIDASIRGKLEGF